MNNGYLYENFFNLSTPIIADACVRKRVPIRVAPKGISQLVPGSLIAGRALPARHYGSVDVFFEAMASAEPGDVLVIDDHGRTDEGCIGDLTALEAKASGLSGIIVWGCHRDTAELKEIEFPVFSYGPCPCGPLHVDPREPNALVKINFGDFTVSRNDAVFADGDGVLFVPFDKTEEILTESKTIWEVERQQARAVKEGKRLRDQLAFDDFIEARKKDPFYTFREHLRKIGGAIEE
jgi:regulator of RNase E activity RraA